MTHPYREVAIVGAYNTRQARRIDDATSRSITFDAIRGAVADAGLEISDVNGLAITPTRPGGTIQSESGHWGYALGLPAFWIGGAPIALPAILEASAAIQSGQCDVVVVASGQAGLYTERASTAPWTRPANEFMETWGMYTAVEFALVARRHMHLFGTTPEQIAHIAATIRNNGFVNPEAVHHGRGPYSAQDVLESRMVADPLHLLDCAVTSEGGSAIVLARRDRISDVRSRPAYIHGGALEASAWCYTHPPTYEDAGTIGRAAAQRSFAMAGLRPDDVDVCQFYDGFSFEVLRQFEAFGFCGEGEGGDFVTSGVIEPEGRFPICTDGGALSHGHTGVSQMLMMVVECVRQLRGDPTGIRVKEPHVALCSTAGSGAMFNPVMILGDEAP